MVIVSMHHVNPSILFRWLIISCSLHLVCALIIGQAAFAQDNFEQKYQAYQHAVRDGKAVLDRKDYQAAIDNYTKAIEASPFVASHYVDRGIAWYGRVTERRRKRISAGRSSWIRDRLPPTLTGAGEDEGR